MNYNLYEKSILERFTEFDRKNPEVYDMFKKYTFQIIRCGKIKTSAKMIVERIRWEQYINTDTKDGFKISNDFTTHLARKFVRDFPEHTDLFNFKRLKS